jgi:hypothetical protein
MKPPHIGFNSRRIPTALRNTGCLLILQASVVPEKGLDCYNLVSLSAWTDLS